MSKCELFHGTSANFLDSIAKLGLLPANKSPHRVFGLSLDDVVCVVDEETKAFEWSWSTTSRHGGERVVLCFDSSVVARIVRFDRNLLEDGQSEAPWYAYEIPDGIEPEHIRVHSSTGCLPLTRSLATMMLTIALGRASANEADRNGDIDAR